jgi:DNA-binding NarL/FixJ family response regulator
MDKAPEDTTTKISVLLADDHTMFRQGLATILTSYGGVEVLGEVPNDSEALRLVGELNPDVVIMQVQIPFERAKESLERMRALPHPPKVIVVTMLEEPYYVRALMELGASAYLVKTSSSEHLVAAVRAAVFDPRAKNAVVGMPQRCWRRAPMGWTAFSRPGSWSFCYLRPAGSPIAR